MFFGTDGIRGIVGKDLDYNFALKVGNSLARTMPKVKVLIARDNRNSSQMLSYGFILGVIMAGGYICDIGVSSTPSVSFLVRDKYDYGVVITASHNPCQYNGIKIFDITGKKISENVEILIEKLVKGEVLINNANIGTCEYKPFLKQKYLKFVQSLFVKSNLKMAFDCANGVMGEFVSKIISKLHLSAQVISDKDYKNVNNNCGATCPQSLFNFVKNNNLDVGFAFDGDGDRLVLVTKDNIYDGDNILFAICKYYKDTGTSLKKVVGTIMSNMGLEKSLKELGIILERTSVGDKYVIERLSKDGLFVGAEQSGHIILKNYLPTGDGLISAIVLLNIFNYYNKKIDDVMYFAKNKQLFKNITVENKYLLQNNTKINDIIAKNQQLLAGDGRIIVRPSGTENKIRIMVESQNESIASFCMEQVVKVIESELCVE